MFTNCHHDEHLKCLRDLKGIRESVGWLVGVSLWLWLSALGFRLLVAAAAAATTTMAVQSQMLTARRTTTTTTTTTAANQALVVDGELDCARQTGAHMQAATCCCWLGAQWAPLNVSVGWLLGLANLLDACGANWPRVSSRRRCSQSTDLRFSNARQALHTPASSRRRSGLVSGITHRVQ